MLIDDRAMPERLLHVLDRPAVRLGTALRRRRLRLDVTFLASPKSAGSRSITFALAPPVLCG